MRGLKKRVLPLFMAGCLVFAMAPTMAFAGDETSEDSVAVIGDTSYETLEAALEAAQSGDEVELLADAALTSTIGSGVTLNVGEYTLSIAYSALSSLIASEGSVSVSEGGTVKYSTTSETIWVGDVTDDEALFQIVEGNITFDIGEMEMVIDGEALVPEDVTSYTMLGTTDYPYDLVVSEDSTLDVEGTLKVISGSDKSGSTLTINGSVDATQGSLSVAQFGEVVLNGTLEIAVLSEEEIEAYKGDISIYGGASFVYAGSAIFGDDAMITLSDDGEADLNLSGYTIDLVTGSSELNDEMKALLVKSDGSYEAFAIALEDGTSMTIGEDGVLDLIWNSSLTVSENATLTVEGALEIQQEAAFSGEATVDGGTVAVYWITDPETASFYLASEGSTVLADIDLSDVITSADAIDTPADLSYTSIAAAVGERTFENGWTFAASSEENTDDTTTDDTTAGDTTTDDTANPTIDTTVDDESTTNVKEAVKSTYSPLKVKSTKVTKKKITITWKAVSGAESYVIYGNKCGKNSSGDIRKLKKLKVVDGDATSLTLSKVLGKKIKSGTYYKFKVVALDADGNVIEKSATVHVVTKGGKYTNAKSVKIYKGSKKVTKVSVKKGKTVKIKTKVVKQDSSKKISKHVGVRYESSNKKIATVNANGKITGKKKGTCYVYAYAQNGVAAKVKVTVK